MARFLAPRLVAVAGAAGVIVALTALVYSGAGTAEFINWDDDVYVSDNARVQAGLTLDGWRWAWAPGTPPYYMPLTWLSFMANAELWGADPAAYHLTNVVLHALNALLLYVVLRVASGAHARSLLVAALFAVHPLHVEAVMWVAQRKEVLSTAFALLGLLAYLRYLERKRSGVPARAWYLAMLLALLLSLLSKPMWLTFPVLLALLDFWPLGRAGGWRGWLDKVPVAIVCAAVLALDVALFDWDAAPLAETIDVTPFAAGWGAIPISYAVFGWKTLFPYPLALPYTDFARAPSAPTVVAALALLTLVTVLVERAGRRAPWLVFGWAWFLVSAATVLFSFGSGKVTPLADHWTYVPHIGLFVALAWSLPLDHPARVRRRVSIAGATILVGALALAAHAQARHWRDAPSLWRHSIAVTTGNHVAHWLWGLHEWNAGNHARGEALMRAAQRLNPTETFYVHRLANLLLAAGRTEQALVEYHRLLGELAASPPVLTSAGISVLRRVGPGEALPLLERAAARTPARGDGTVAPARFYLWLALLALDRTDAEHALREQIRHGDGVDLAALCGDALVLLARLRRVDPAWAPYLAVVRRRCGQVVIPAASVEGPAP